MIGVLIGDIWPYIAGAVASIAAFAGVYLKGRKDQRQKAIIKKAKSDEKTHERIDGVDPVDPSDNDAVVKRLRQLSK